MLANVELWRIKQDFPSRKLPDLTRSVRDEVRAAWPKAGIKAGERVALTVGSRGIANLAHMVIAICGEIRAHGATPVIIPAMGSHGGATPEGQTQVLADYGVTPESTGAEIDARMEVRRIGVSPEGMNVYVAESALACDRIIVFNRVKPHTDFKGEIESGLCKIMAIGLGKREGANYYHRSIIDFGFARALEAAGRFVLATCPVAFGIAVVEDAFEDTAIVQHLMPDELVAEEKKLQATAKQWMARLPFSAADILMLDFMGKNISGTGMDTNVIGRFQSIYAGEDLPEPRIKRIYVRDLTPESHGNALGMGRADFISKRLYDKLDFNAMYINGITGLGIENARMPIVMNNDREALEALNTTIGHVPPDKLKFIWARDTLTVVDCVVSGAYLEECRSRDDIAISGRADARFLEDGWLVSPFHA